MATLKQQFFSLNHFWPSFFKASLIKTKLLNNALYTFKIDTFLLQCAESTLNIFGTTRPIWVAYNAHELICSFVYFEGLKPVSVGSRSSHQTARLISLLALTSLIIDTWLVARTKRLKNIGKGLPSGLRLILGSSSSGNKLIPSPSHRSRTAGSLITFNRPHIVRKL